MNEICSNPEKDIVSAQDIHSTASCPECGKAVEHEGGCVVCRHCGFSKCG
jgi:ribonucleoside-diphosphate reductase alpha chain